MIHKTGMTIDVYLRNAGIKSHGTTQRKNFIPLKAHPGTSFSDRLSSVISSNPSHPIKKKTGLTITDYLNQAASGASNRIIQSATSRNGSLLSGGLDMPSRAFQMPITDRVTTDSASRGGSMGGDAGEKIPPESETLVVEIVNSIKSAAQKYNLPEKLIKSVIKAESNFQADAVSPAGAQGLMQLMPATAKELGVEDPFNARQNIDGGARYLRQMLDHFGQDIRLALAAYNAGPGTVEKYNGNVPYRETQTYIERVLKGATA